MHVGVREFRGQLRRWLDAVKRGDEITITERGIPVARLIAASGLSKYEKLVADGVITPAKNPKPSSKTFRPVKARGTVSDLIPEQRR